ncbi:hypothetical protein FAD_1513 [Ferroplasma acidiphilum]|uniref:Uncharacterized protein n=2 Tax=Ferroplasma TaxID=74968 RepID=S0AMU5_FERAC|nr:MULTISPECIES: hypothetical protein [Ferroplasma]AGO60603.1 hypothetical protein FACI_IFERC00001G0623 [Ferroplasma acidarmanus Fer1]ARD85365.1 hypothetical protein FAD_1513 [Ferroplasma acidiphilum]WMT52473.1 MAG: hypothetical protein RE473_05530 [Ferroplasma acidiphilum]
MDQKTIIQINIEVPHIVGTVVKESKKFFDGGIELLRFGSRIIGNNQETKKPVKQLSKIEIK